MGYYYLKKKEEKRIDTYWSKCPKVGIYSIKLSEKVFKIGKFCCVLFYLNVILDLCLWKYQILCHVFNIRKIHQIFLYPL